jgi:hypothetical protein
MDTPEVEAHAHHHRTGIRWLDASMALSAFAISIISLFVAIHHGQTMKEMAAANARMVAASSWPFVEYSTGNVSSSGAPEISLDITNQGVGPARIEKFAILYRDQPVKSTIDLMNACCNRQPADVQVLSDMTDSESSIVTSAVEGRILAAREENVFLKLRRTPRNAAVWDRLNTERMRVRAQICYCSVFDECWTTERPREKATRVDHCPENWTSYSE